jgi:hypothetical protein
MLILEFRDIVAVVLEVQRGGRGQGEGKREIDR